ALRACLVAHGGHGFAFIDASDCEDERRFSLAHELAHFLHDYLEPRRRIVQLVGLSALEVLDGYRAPTADERVHAVLSQTTVGCHVHLLDRDREGQMLSRAVTDAESGADRLAFELLAPAEHVWSAITTGTRPPSAATI